MNQNFKEIKITYQNQAQIQKLALKDNFYQKIGQILKTDSDELVIIINNDYDQMVPRNYQCSQLQSGDNYNAYNIKNLLKESGLTGKQISSRNEKKDIVLSIQTTYSQEITQEGDYDQSILESVTKEIKQLCYLCKININGYTIQTSCYHHYHSQCLKQSIIQQIDNNGLILICNCKQQIKVPSIVNQIQDLKVKIDSLFKNQIKNIYTNNQNKIKKCQKKKDCNFIYIEKDNQSVSYCENCDKKESNQITTQ
ncbi:unnamed protein product [Paramecium pentaurelia]|uniref:RING-type domain-containing protein n=1 Tax=Paramecium pentaurelia TaxID=43138 RepID=A0A8S1V8R4_9CILI|nr:unnamed protein product [Paramecium pentaurelia]